MTSSPLIRRAFAINPADLLIRSGPKDPDGVAGASAKRMMGAANPIASNPEGGSTMCVTCNRWHRPGSMCTKSMEPLIQKGRRVAVYHGMTPGNSFRDPSSGSYAGAPETGAAASEVSLEGVKHAVTSHNYSQPESWAPPLPQTVPALEQQHTQNQQPAQSESAAPAAPAPPPVPFAINGIHNLLTYQPDPSKPQDGSKKLADNSAQLQNQQAGYLTALRNWQSMYGAAQPAPTGMAV